MKSITMMLAYLIGLPALAQETQTDAITFVVELNDEQIEQLKQGISLQTLVPEKLRNKVAVVQVRYKPNAPAANAQSGTGQTPSNGFSQNRPSGSNQPSNNSFGLGDAKLNRPADGSRPFNRNLNRLDSNFNSSSLESLLPPNRNNPAANAGANFGPNSSPPKSGGAFPDFKNIGQNNGIPIRSGGNQPNSGQWNPPATRRNTNPNPNSTPGSQPATGPGSTGMYNQPANTSAVPGQPANNNFQNRPPSSTRPPAPQGNEYDTMYNRWNNNPLVNRNLNATPRANFQEGGMGPLAGGQTNPYASTGHVNDYGLYRRPSMVSSHYVPPVPNQMPVTNNRAGYRFAQNNAAGTEPNQNGRLPPSFIDSNLESPTPSDQPISDQPPISSIDQANRYNGVLWFMLFCSIGLNVYLAWISRGFYVRYRELADELRESFSSAI